MNEILYSAPTVSAPNLGTPASGRLAVHPSSASPLDTAGLSATMDYGRSGHNFEPGSVRYIKLGENGKWATDALGRGIIPFGYRSVDHGDCIANNWDEVGQQLVGMGRTARGVSQGLRELKDFYGLPENTLWVTMADGHFWWAFAKGPVVGVEQGISVEPARYRLTKAGWSKTSLTGDPLTVRVAGELEFRWLLDRDAGRPPAEQAKEPNSTSRGRRFSSGVGRQIGREGKIRPRLDSKSGNDVIAA
jgi:hypothetical protein